MEIRELKKLTYCFWGRMSPNLLSHQLCSTSFSTNKIWTGDLGSFFKCNHIFILIIYTHTSCTPSNDFVIKIHKFQITISFKINSEYYLSTKWLHDKEIHENKIKPQTLRKSGMIYLILDFFFFRQISFMQGCQNWDPT